MIVSLADMKSYLGIGDNSEDAFLTVQLGIIQSAIETYCRRKFDQATYIQTFYSMDFELPQNFLFLYQFPVISVASITEDLTPFTDFRIHQESGVITRKDYYKFFMSKLVKETVVTYDAGYAYADMPKELQSVVYSLVEERYSKKKSGVALNFGSDVQRVSIPGTISIDFDYSLSNNDRSTPMGTIIGQYLNVVDVYRSERTIVGGGKLAYVTS